MTCTDWFELVSAAADDQLASDERARLDEHLVGCASCRALLGTFEQERRRQRLSPPADHGALVSQVLDRRAADPAHPHPRPGRDLARRGVLASVAVVAVVLSIATAPRGSTPAPTPAPTGAEVASGPEVLIDAKSQTFDDADIEVAAGTTVEWRNTGTSTHHLVRRLGGVLVSEDLTPGTTEAATFAEPGTYEFWCTIHQGMSGTVTVDA